MLLPALLSISRIIFAQAPAAPTQLYAVASFYYVPDIHLSWSGDNSLGSSSYRVYRSPGDTVHFQLIATTYYTSYNDFQLLPGGTYYYYVTAVAVRDTTHIESAASATINVTATGPGGGGGGGGKRQNSGTIAGRVVDSLTGKAIPAVQVSFFRVSSPGLPVQKTLTDGSGHYKAALDTGMYLVNAQPPLAGGTGLLYQLKWYRNASDPAHADPIHVADTSRAVADFELAKPSVAPTATIAGMVEDSSGYPLGGATIVVMRSAQEMYRLSSSNDDLPGLGSESMDIDGLGHGEGVVWKGVTNQAGNYSATVLTGHSYVVLALMQGFVPQFFDHQSSPLTANPLNIQHDTSNINFDLGTTSPLARFRVSGTVGDSSGVRVPSRIVLIPLHHLVSRTSPLFTYTDSTGAYAFAHVGTGKYFALAVPFSKYAPAYFKAGSFGIARWQLADTINVGGDVTGVDIGVVPITVNGITHLDGKIRTGGIPVPGVNIYAAADDGSLVGYGLSDDSGVYSIEGLPSGHITLSSDIEEYQPSHNAISLGGGGFSTSGVDLSIVTEALTSVSTTSEVPQDFALLQNYPNPFNPSTTISFSVPVASTVSLKVFSVLGQEVATLSSGPVAGGKHEFVWDARDKAGMQVASGAYLLRLVATPIAGGSNFVALKKMLLVR